MSAEYSIHVEDRPVRSKTDHLGPVHATATVRLIFGGKKDWKTESHVLLFIKDDRLWELSRLFTDLGQSLAALAPPEEAKK